MASPQSNNDFDASGESKQLEQITFRFCSECSNMLYPKEDEEAHKLQYTCRTCQYTEEATTSCVFRNILNNTSGETAGVTQDVGSDPTVSQVMPSICLSCGTFIACRVCGSACSPLGCVAERNGKASAFGVAPTIADFTYDSPDAPSPMTEDEFFARFDSSSFQLACAIDMVDGWCSASSDSDVESFTQELLSSLSEASDDDDDEMFL